MQVYVVCQRDALLETVGVSGTREECQEHVAHLRRTKNVIRILNAAGQEIDEFPAVAAGLPDMPRMRNVDEPSNP